MLNELLRKYFQKSPPAAPVASAPEPTPDTPPGKKPAVKKKQPLISKDKKIFIGIGVAVLAINFVLTALSEQTEIDPNQESVIPLAQLTGKIGQRPQPETPEQQFRRENKNLPMPDGTDIPPDVLKERTQIFQTVPFGDNELAYEMRLPTNWGQSRFTQYGSPGKEKYEILTNIDRFFGPAIEDVRPFVWLEVERLQRLTTSELYLNAYFIKRGITPETMKVHDGHRAEALYLETRDYNTYVMRTLAVVNGDRLVLVTFGVPIAAYKTYRDLIGMTLTSYRPLQKIERGLEPVNKYKLLNVLTFDYPKRWIIRNENRKTSINPSVEFVLPTELNLTASEIRDQLNGVIIVNAWRHTPDYSRTVLEQSIVKRLKQSRIEMQDVLQAEKQLPSTVPGLKITQTVYVGLIDSTTPTTEEFGIIQDRSSFPRQEIWVTTYENANYTAAVTLVSWPQTKNYQNWSYNVISYQAILDSLKLRDVNF